jgi:Mn2+/Fe2+ NRAMP family transporter
LGLIGSGFLAVPILTGSGAYAMASAFGWKEGLDRKPSQAKQFYIIIGISTLVAMQINFMGINPISALFWSAVINGLIAPPLLIIVALIASSKEVMGKWTNGVLLSVVTWLAAAIMLALEIAAIVIWIRSSA